MNFSVQIYIFTSLCNKLLLFLSIVHVTLFILGLLWITYAISIPALVFAMFHASLRPVEIEFNRYKSPTVVASDGFIDEKDKEVTITFHQDLDCTSSMMTKDSSSSSISKRSVAMVSGQLRHR